MRVPVFLIGAILAGGWCSRRAAAQSVAVELPVSASGFAASPTSGTSAVIVAESDQVIGYPRLAGGDLAREMIQHVGPSPVRIVCKSVGDRSYFLVLCRGDHSIYVLDDQNLKILKRIELSGGDPTCLAAASDPASPWAFYDLHPAAQPNRGFQGFAIGRINLQSLTDGGMLDMSRVSTPDNVDEIEASPDGSILYGRRSHTGPTGIFVFRVQPGANSGRATLDQISYQHESASYFLAAPDGQYAAHGTKLFSADLLNPITDLPGEAICFMQDQPILFTLNAAGDQLAALSCNSLKVLDRASLPEINQGRPVVRAGGARGVRRAPNRRVGQTHPVAQYDAKDKTLLIFQQNRVSSVPLSTLNLPNEPSLSISIDGSTHLMVGQQAKLRMTARNPGATIELESAPPGMTLVGGNLQGSVPAQTVGPVSLRLRISAKGFQRTQDLILDVGRPEIHLPFVPSELAISPDGSFAAALAPRQEQVNGYNPANPPTPGTRLAVVDLRNGSVAAQRSVPNNLRAVAIDGANVYATSPDSDAFFVLARKDLSDVRRVFTRGRVNTILPIARTLIAMMQQGPSVRYSLPDLTPLDVAPEGSVAYMPPWQTTSPVRVNDGWYFRGIVWNSDLTAPRLIIRPDGFSPMPGAGRQQFLDPNGAAPAGSWGVQLYGNRLTRLGGQTIGQVRGHSPVLLEDVPAVASLDREEVQNRGRPERRDKRQVIFCDLITAQVAEPLVLYDEPAPHLTYGQPFQSERLVSASGVLLAQINDRLFVLSTRTTPAARFPVPFTLTINDPVVVAERAHKAIVGFTTRGGKPPIQYALSAEAPGFEIDKVSGKVTIDAGALTPRAIEAVSDVLAQRMGQSVPGLNSYRTATTQPLNQSPAAVLAEYQKSQTARFASMSAKPAIGIPVAVTFGVVAQDTEQQTANGDTLAFVMIPPDVVLSRLKQKISQNQQVASRTVPVNPSGRPATQPVNEIESLRQQVMELKRQNQVLEAQNQLLKELLQGRQAGPATRRSGG